jgi:hypothetical protein
VRISSDNQVVEDLRAHKAVPINVRAIRELKKAHDVINPRTAVLLVFFPLSKRLTHVLLVDSTHSSTGPDAIESLNDDDGNIADDLHFANCRR